MQKRRFCLFTILLILAACGLIAAGGCDKGNYERFVVISGEVLDAGSQEPIDSVWAALGDTLLPEARWYSEVKGRFSVTSMPFLGPYALSVGRAGYFTAVDTLENIGSDVDGLRYELERAP